MAYKVWSSGSGSPIARSWSRRRALELAREAVERGRRGVTVYDGNGNVYSPKGRATSCPDCHCGSGEHHPGPPHCPRA